MRYIRTERWRFVYYLGDLNELYDLEDDPYELEKLLRMALSMINFNMSTKEQLV